MHKSIDLKLKLHVEGDEEPATDFQQAATQVVKDMLAAGRLRHPTYKVTVKDAKEESNDDDDAPAK
jgi:hypothetical protein